MKRMEPFFSLDAPFPLTLTLSLGERGQPLPVFVKPVSHRAGFSRGFAQPLGAFLPLPEGEGRGEGEGISQFERLDNVSRITP